MTQRLTSPQMHTLRWIQSRPLHAREIHPQTLRVLLERGYVKESFFRVYIITDRGRDAIGVPV